MTTVTRTLVVTLTALVVSLASPQGAALAQETGNVIFFHPDGTGVNHWSALRTVHVGPDAELNWDKLPGMAVYAGHMKDAMSGTSHGGATVHAYGVKVQADSFGMDGREPLTAASGKPMSLMHEAMAAGKAVGTVQSGHIAEPGTAVFLASSPARADYDGIARQVIESGARVIMAGGERYLLPENVDGRHGKGSRKDSLDLIETARQRGYTVVYTKDELAGLDLARVDKLLGVFARNHTFNDQTEEKNRAEGKPHYVATAPTIAEMTAAALAILSRDPNGFFLVAEEEGTDNMANNNNAPGQFEALARADAAIGMIRSFIAQNPKTLMVMAADSDAGGLQIIGPSPRSEAIAPGKPLPARDQNGAPLDGVQGAASEPFMSAPDRNGKRWPFAVVWAANDDVTGGILVRADGLNSQLVRGKMDSTELYRVMYLTLFGRALN